ncbi:MAG TPA: hypothetical protein VMY42_19110, partial [Thermoguttaceae bacterium]|nr:hypothetical protein [Thermoguttaceae bacterium]
MADRRTGCNRLASVRSWTVPLGGDPIVMPGGGTAYGEEREAKHYVYDVHDRLIHEYCIDPD